MKERKRRDFCQTWRQVPILVCSPLVTNAPLGGYYCPRAATLPPSGESTRMGDDNIRNIRKIVLKWILGFYHGPNLTLTMSFKPFSRFHALFNDNQGTAIGHDNNTLAAASIHRVRVRERERARERERERGQESNREHLLQ